LFVNAQTVPRSLRVTTGSIASWTARAEADILRLLNAFMEPWIMAGYGAPVFWPTGMIVLETTGARSGRRIRTPLLAAFLDGHAVVATLRGARSQWARNLRVRPEVRYWLAGRARAGRAHVFAPGERRPATEGFPPLARMAAEVLLPPATSFGWTFAVISPS
jgi:deazaflavin-dependent oxidoreductase (nitroreductase family)